MSPMLDGVAVRAARGLVMTSLAADPFAFSFGHGVTAGHKNKLVVAVLLSQRDETPGRELGQRPKRSPGATQDAAIRADVPIGPIPHDPQQPEHRAAPPG